VSPIIGDFVSGQSNVTYTRMRMLLAESGGGLQEGVVGATDLKGQQRAAGANMSIEAPPGACWVTVDTGTRNGIGHGFVDATQNPSVTASNGTLPRVDQLVVRWNDTAIPTGTGGNVPTVEVITGTATSGATLDNRTGAAALPNDCLRLADILVPATSTSVTTANIRDRRPWARGAYRRIFRTANAAAGSDYTTALTTFAGIDPTNLKPRIECSGVPVRISLRGRMTNASAAGIYFIPAVDGVVAPEAASGDWMGQTLGVSQDAPLSIFWDIVPAAGSHLLEWAWRTTAGTATLFARSTVPLQLIVEEIVRPNAENT
jgi:hypothetical protein